MARLFALAVLLLAAVPASAADRPKAKVLFIGKDPDHPHGSHMYMHVGGMLAKCVRKVDGVEAVVSNGWPQDPKTLEGVTAIVMYTSPGAEFLLLSKDRDAVDALVRKGVGLVTIHWASTVRKENFDRLSPTWLGYLGGTWISNVGLSSGKSPLRRLIPDHPLCNGWKEYQIDDEYYLNPVIKDAKPFLQVTEKGGKDVIVGWVYERPDGGRSFATTLGHPYRNFVNASFRRMLVNAILWSAKLDVPKDGADVTLTEKDLELPPNPKAKK